MTAPKSRQVEMSSSSMWGSQTYPILKVSFSYECNLKFTPNYDMGPVA